MGAMTGHRPPATEATAGGGVFGLIGRVVVRWPWLVLALWIAVAAGLSQLFPPLTVLAQKAPPSILPADAPSLVSAQQVAKAFDEASSDNIMLLVLTNDKGLTKADEAVYGKLAATLRADTEDVAALQDFITTPPLREILVSKDRKAWLLPVNIVGDPGTPRATAATKRAVEKVRAITKDSNLETYITGPAGTFSDVQDIGEKDTFRIEVATVVALLGILLMIYRNPLTMVLPLITIGVSLVAAQGVVAGLGTAGLGISQQTIVLLTAMMAGAGTDYAVFLISRYHDYLRLGCHSDDAVRNALESVGKVIAASAATVAVTFLGMIFTKLTVFSTVGVALAVAICVGFLGAVTFLPALLVLAGRRGWAKPRRDLTSRFWKRSGIRIVRRPAINLAVSLVILVCLASLVMLANYNYDDRKALPSTTESIRGYDAISRHFPLNASLPQYVLISSPHDLRTPKGLADMEQMAFRISQIPDIDIVRGITRPTGESIEQARLSFQAGEIGKPLNQAGGLISSQDGNLNLLVYGADQVADTLGVIRGQIGQALTSVSTLLPALAVLQGQLGTGKSLPGFYPGNSPLSAVHGLGGSPGAANPVPSDTDLIASSNQTIDSVLRALAGNPVCDADPSCVASRAALQQSAATRADGTPGASSPAVTPTPTPTTPPALAAEAPVIPSPSPSPSPSPTPTTAPSPSRTPSSAPIPGKETPVPGVDTPPIPARVTPGVIPGTGGSNYVGPALDSVTESLRSAGINNSDDLNAQLRQLQQGLGLLADASRQVADGVQLLVEQTKRLGAGLDQASAFLLSMKREATTPSMAGFYIPAQILNGEEFRKAAGIFISADGHTARYLVQTKHNPFSLEAMDQVNDILETARSAQPNTTLSDASISMTGFSVTLRDIRDYYHRDLRLIVITTILVVLGILIVLLRALVAPLYLILSVVISYLSALGLGILTFQLILGQELHWSVPGLTFIILVAVGADYNLLLISRIRDESPHGIRSGVIRTVTQTGGVITAAGLIFAASMLGLQFSTITTLVQMGFIIGMGILLDTFLVRTITVPATAVLVGKANWWPSRWQPADSVKPKARRPAVAPAPLGPDPTDQGSTDQGPDDGVEPPTSPTT